MCDVSVVVVVDAEMDERSVNDVSETDNVIVSQWREMSADAKHELRDKIDETLRPLGLETVLVDIKRANNIALHFFCLSLSAVRSLRDQWRSRQLRDIVDELFTLLSTASDRVPVETLIWRVTENAQCFFNSLQGKEFSYILCTCNWLK